MSGRHHLLELGAVDQLSVRVGLHPGATLFTALWEVFGGRQQGLPPPWREATRAAVPAGALSRVRPVLTQACWVPDALGLTDDLSLTRPGDVVERLRAHDPDRLAGEVVERFDGEPPPLWRPLVDDPAGFLAAYVTVVDGVARALAPRWHAARRLLARESERIGVAAVTGTVDALLTGMPAPVHYRHGALRLPDPRAELGLGGRRLTLIPMVSGTGAGLSSLDRCDTVWLAYPVPGLGRLEADPAPAEGRDPLAVVLGGVRAEIVRRLEQRPTPGELADRLGMGANTVTYHCDQLAAAGLLLRERHGRQVMLLPTERGTALLELLGNG